jgi:hypothetical protein
MAKRVLRFPRPPKPDPNGPTEWAIFQVGDTRAVIDLRGSEPKLRTEPAEVISIERERKPTSGKTSVVMGDARGARKICVHSRSGRSNPPRPSLAAELRLRLAFCGRSPDDVDLGSHARPSDFGTVSVAPPANVVGSTRSVAVNAPSWSDRLSRRSQTFLLQPRSQCSPRRHCAKRLRQPLSTESLPQLGIIGGVRDASQSAGLCVYRQLRPRRSRQPTRPFYLPEAPSANRNTRANRYKRCPSARHRNSN